MPLTGTIKDRIGQLISEGYPQEQAVAIAYHSTGEAQDSDQIRAAGAIVSDALGRVLLLHRAGECDYPGTWGFPGGKIEEGETPAQAAAREVLEETGLTLADPMSAGLLVDGFVSFPVPLGVAAPVALSVESDGYQWADPCDLPAAMHPAALVALDAWQDQQQAAPAMDERIVDVNGYLTRPNNPILRAGVFPYRGYQIPNAPDPAAIYRVYLPPEEITDPEAMRSFCLLPIVDEHAMLGDGYQMPAELKGVHGTTGEDPKFDGETLTNTLRVFSETMRGMIERDEKFELSPGYRCRFIPEAGIINGQSYDFVQRRLRGNHLALVDSSRRDIAVMDAADKQEATVPDPIEEKKEPGTPAKDAAPAAPAGEGGDLKISDLAELVGKIAPALEQLMADVAKLGGGAAAAAAPHTEPDGDELAAAEDSAAGLGRKIAAAWRERDQLAREVGEVIGHFDAAAMDSAEDVAKYALGKLKIDAGAHPVATLRGYLGAKVKAIETHAEDEAAKAGSVIRSYFEGK